jgi:hypothetical protein
MHVSSSTVIVPFVLTTQRRATAALDFCVLRLAQAVALFEKASWSKTTPMMRNDKSAVGTV